MSSEPWVAVEGTEDACWIVKPSADIETWIYLHDAGMAQRIVESVNACQGYSTEDLKGRNFMAECREDWPL